MQCNDPFAVSFDPDFDATNCPPGCDCSHVFTSQPDASPQVGWIDNDDAIEVGRCVDNRITIDGSNLIDLYRNVPARIPLFSGRCNGGYNIAGFGCFELTSQSEQNDWPIPKLPGQICAATIQRVIEMRVDCTCTICCGSAGGLPEPTDATIPVLVQ
jgi:hypothetical protein